MAQQTAHRPGSRLRLQRLRADSSRVAFDRETDSNPFVRLRRHAAGGSFPIAFHTAGLVELSTLEREAVAFLSRLPADHHTLIRSPGSTDSPLGDVPAYRLEPGADRDVDVVLDHDQSTTRTSVRYVDDLIGVDSVTAPEHHERVALKAAERLGSIVFVTTSQSLLSLPQRRAGKILVSSPLEALPLVSAWDRARGDYRHGIMSTSAHFYSECLARALTRAADRSFIGLSLGEFTFDDGEALVDVAGSIGRRLANALRVVDAMYATNQVPTNNHTLDEQTDAFDHVVLLIAAIHDDLAHLAQLYFGIHDLDKKRVGLREPAFRRALRGTGDVRAQHLADALGNSGPKLWVHVELRHQAIHRPRLQQTVYRHESDPEEARFRVAEPLLTDVWGSITKLGEDPADWGFSGRVGPHVVPISFLGSERRVMRHSPGEALLDPLPFALRLVSLTGDLINLVLTEMDVASDARLTEEQRAACDRKGSRWPMRLEDGPLLIAASPIGLVRSLHGKTALGRD